MIKTQPTQGHQNRQLDAGPVAPYLDILVSSLEERHYASDTIRHHVYAARAFGRWLARSCRTLPDANEEVVSLYIMGLRKKSERGNRTLKTVSALPHLLAVIRAQGVTIKPIPKPPRSATTQWLDDFDNYLSRVLGLAPASLRKYRFFIRRFLEAFCGSDGPDWSLLRAEDLTAFVHKEASRLNGHARKSPITAIRVLLRYLTFKGAVRGGLEAAVPRMPQWKHAALPRYLSEEEVERVVASALDDTPQRQRNYAILLLLARVGLRAHEVIQLVLDNIDWVEGSLLIRAGKSRRERRLPLAQDVGTALCAYLEHWRPRSSLRTVFLQARAPFGPFRDSSTIAKIVRRAMARAGVINHSAAAHLFRHSAATHMVSKGASFKEIADVLGHESLQTTAIYAKLNLEALSRVAMPWPGGVR